MTKEQIIKRLNKYNIVCSNLEERKSCLEIFKQFGLKITEALGVDFLKHPKFLVVVWGLEQVSADGRLDFSERKPIPFSRFYEFFQDIRMEVVLNSEYIAVFSADEVTVGCQKFPLSVIPSLYEAYQKVKETA